MRIASDEVSSTDGNVDLSFLGLTEDNYDVISYLIKSNNDLEQFLKNYWEVEVNEFLAVAKYREFRRNKNPLNYATFCMLVGCNKVAALEYLFQHKISEADVLRLEKCIKEGYLTMQELYEKSVKSPNMKLARFLHAKRLDKHIERIITKKGRY